MKYIITESHYKNLLEDDDRLNRMAEKYLNSVFDNLTQVDTKFGSGFKFKSSRLDISYLFNASDINNPLENTLRFSLSFDFGEIFGSN